MIIKTTFYSKESVVLKVFENIYSLLFQIGTKPIVLTDFDKALYLK
jgi:hypothetical protein